MLFWSMGEYSALQQPLSSKDDEFSFYGRSAVSFYKIYIMYNHRNVAIAQYTSELFRKFARGQLNVILGFAKTHFDQHTYTVAIAVH